MSNFNIEYDKWNLIVYQGDGGDSANRTLCYLVVQSWEDNPADLWMSGSMVMFTHPWLPGIHRRHPDETKWYSQWNRMSRDQTVPLLIACAEYDMPMYAVRYILGHLTRLFLFTTNIIDNGIMTGPYKIPDPTGPDFWALEIRALPLILGLLCYPLLLVFDLYSLFSAVFLRFFNRSQNDVINHVMMSIHNQRRIPTPFSWLTNVLVNSAGDLQQRLDNFFGSDPAQIKFNDILRPWLLKYFSK